jgi:pimeloyl-ACP methyl ester carboxylesterase
VDDLVAPPEVAAVSEQVLQILGLEVQVRRSGHGAPAVVLHHSTGPLWSGFHDALARSVAVSMPDLPGYGRSQRPDWARSPRDEAILVGGLLDALELDRVHLVGLGLGGWIAAELATMAQARLSTLTLVGAAGVRPRAGFIHDPLAAGFSDYVHLGFHDKRKFFELFGDPVSDDLWNLWDFSREMTCRLTWRPWMFSDELAALLPLVRVPALVVWGADDQVVPLDCGHLYAERLADARLEVVPASGHNVDLEHPDELARLVLDHIGAQA